jgi:hypothetical protein
MKIPNSGLLHDVLSPLGDIYAYKHGAAIINDKVMVRTQSNDRWRSNVHETRIAVDRSVDGAWCPIACLF